MATILVLNGPNLNLLGTREPEHYGSTTLDEVVVHLDRLAREAGHVLVSFQSNAEHELINRIHQVPADGIGFIILNPGAFTHTSIAIRDAIQAVRVPFIEVHLSNIFAREEFRHRSYFSDIAVGIIGGFGALGYELALQGAVDYIERQKKQG